MSIEHSIIVQLRMCVCVVCLCVCLCFVCVCVCVSVCVIDTCGSVVQYILSTFTRPHSTNYKGVGGGRGRGR